MATQGDVTRQPAPPNLTHARRVLDAHRQPHVLAFWDELTPAQQTNLLIQVEVIDFSALERLIERYVKQSPAPVVPQELEPAPYYPHQPAADHDYGAFRRAGEELLRTGTIAAFTVAGGQGTRLGWNGPKGTYPGTPVTGKPLFRLFAEQIAAAERRYGVTIPWYIMTSPMNDADTRDFFADNNSFGLNRRNIFIFPQGTVPSIEAETGKLLLAEKWEIARNPDGHGGSIKALADSGAIEDMRGRGIAHISYFQVDNPLVKVIDPLFIGLHATAPDSSTQMSSKMVAKVAPEEKVGVFCRADGATQVIEYTDLSEALAKARDDADGLRFNAGNVAIHLLSVAFVGELTGSDDGFALPWHRADKKAPYVDTRSGARIEPDRPNAVKLETFVFDAIPLAKSSIVYETSRAEEFAPIKNATGVDSPATSHQLQSNLFGSWLEARGVHVPRDAQGNVQASIEISPLTATSAEQIPANVLPKQVTPGSEVAL